MQKQNEAKTLSGCATRWIYFVWILRYAQYDEVGGLPRFGYAESSNDESGQIRARFVVDSQGESQSK